MFENENYFTLFNLEEGFLIDVKKFDISYLRLYDAVNSKLLSSENDIEKEFLNSYLAMLNQAYEVLKDDMKRAEHLLLQNNVLIPNPSQAFMASLFDNEKDDISTLKTNTRTLMVHYFSIKDFEKAAEEYVKLKVLEKLH